MKHRRASKVEGAACNARDQAHSRQLMGSHIPLTTAAEICAVAKAASAQSLHPLEVNRAIHRIALSVPRCRRFFSIPS